MHGAVFYLAVVWATALLGATTVRLITERSALSRIVALDTLTLVIVSLLTLFAGRRATPFFLDAALVLALVSFGATVAATRYREGRLFS